MTDIPRITAVEPVPVVVSGAHDFAISEGRTRVHTSVILKLVTEDEGLEGIAEIVCAPPGKPGSPANPPAKSPAAYSSCAKETRSRN